MGDAAILSATVAGVTLRNPVLLAAGTCGTLDEMSDVLDLSRVGGLVTKSITLRPREGNATWRIVPARAGMLNAIGLANVGLDHFMEHVAPRIAGLPTRVFGSIAGFSIEDYVTVAGAFDEIDSLAGIELNVSCPNVKGGVEFGLDPPALSALVSAVRVVVRRKPLLVKLSPISSGHPSMVEVARAAIEPGGGARGGRAGRSGADALCIANTIPAMAIDVRTRRPRLANVTGGLSGPAVHAVAVKLVHDVYRGVAKEAGVPIIGIGGVIRWEDAAEFILAGASAVEVGTALFADPRAPVKIARGLERWVLGQGVESIGGLVGQVQV